MRLPEDVALETATVLHKMIQINAIKNVKPLHVDVAHKIVRTHLIADTIQWYRYMVGQDYV